MREVRKATLVPRDRYGSLADPSLDHDPYVNDEPIDYDVLRDVEERHPELFENPRNVRLTARGFMPVDPDPSHWGDSDNEVSNPRYELPKPRPSTPPRRAKLRATSTGVYVRPYDEPEEPDEMTVVVARPQATTRRKAGRRGPDAS